MGRLLKIIYEIAYCHTENGYQRSYVGIFSPMGLPSEIARSFTSMFYTYILQSKKDGKFYYGYTADLAQRFEQHAKGLVESTRARRPLKLVYYEACCIEQDALKRERYFKTYRGRQFIQKRLKSYFTGLK